MNSEDSRIGVLDEVPSAKEQETWTRTVPDILAQYYNVLFE